MANKVYKPTTPGRRNYSVASFEEVTKTSPEKTLTVGLRSNAGRNNTWRITIRRRWWGHKRLYRIIDFKRSDKAWIECTVNSIEYDPNRTAYIALVFYTDWEKRYIIAPEWLQVWEKLVCDDKAEIKTWNRMRIKNIPVWYSIYNVEIDLWKWGQMVKTAWSSATLTSLDWEYAQVALPSWEVRYVNKEAFVTIWRISNSEHSLIRIWKAWRQRWLWRRPKVLWKSMGVHDHPHWGWEWHSPIGMKAPKTPWWMPALWFKTRKRNKWTNKWVAVSKHRNKKK